MADNRNTLVDYKLYARGSQVEWKGVKAKNMDYRELVSFIGHLTAEIEDLRNERLVEKNPEQGTAEDWKTTHCPVCGVDTSGRLPVCWYRDGNKYRAYPCSEHTGSR